MTKINNLKLSNKLFQLNQYLKQDIEKAEESVQFWAESEGVFGADTQINPKIDPDLTYGKIHQDIGKRIKSYKNQIEENEELIKILRESL